MSAGLLLEPHSCFDWPHPMLDRPKIHLVTFGSRGDAHPFVAVGQALLREGCRAIVATSAEHREMVLSAGLEYAEVRPDATEVLARLGLDMQALARSLAANDRILFEKIIFPHLWEAFKSLDLICEDSDTIITHSLAFSAHAVAQRRGVPLALLTLSPVLLPSAHDPPKGWGSPFISDPNSALGLGYNRLALRVAAELAWLWAAPLRRFRRELGLPPRGGFGFFSPPDPDLQTIGLFSPLLTRTPPDPTEKTLVAGHSFFDDPSAEDAGERAGLELFLDSGPAPIVITLGSFFVHDGLSHYREALAASRALGERVVLLARREDVAALQHEVGPEVFVGSYLRHSTLFPRSSLVVHHGGVGTLGQAMRAGRPQLVTPYLGEQQDNAARLKRLGVARVLPARQVTPSALAAELSALLGDAAYAANAEAVAAKVSQEDGAAVAARRIVEIARARR
jgi:rhamnosyltransferase subunit B